MPEQGRGAPLALLTRPAGRHASLASALADAGLVPCELPALQIQEPAVLPEPLPLPGDYDLLMFVSGAAVRAYRRLCDRAGLRVWPANTWAAAVGPATLAAWDEAGEGPVAPHSRRIAPDHDAGSHDSESLLDLLVARGLPLRRVLVVRAGHGRNWLADQLRARGAEVDLLAAYQRVPAPWPAEMIPILSAAAASGRQAIWLATSAESIAATRAQAEAAGLLGWWKSGCHIVTHPRLAQRLLDQATGAGPHAMVKICLPLDSSILHAFVAFCSETD